MKKIFKVSYKVYPFDCLVCVGVTTKEIIKRLESYNFKLTEEEKEALDMSGNGRTIMLEGGQTIMRLQDTHLPTITHEIFHAVHFLFDKIHIDLCLESGEAFAYMTQFLTEEIVKKLKQL